MLLTAIAMELDGADPSPVSAPHVGLYWAKNTERTKFFDYVATIIHKLVSQVSNRRPLRC